MKFILMIALIAGCALVGTVRADGSAEGAGTRHTWWRVSFETAVPFAAPAKIGLDAVALAHPPETAGGVGRIEIVLAAASKGMVDAMGMNDAEMLGYFKSTFMGLASPATRKTERVFLGLTLAGGAQSTSIPRARNVESYLIPLAGGAKLFLAVAADAAVSAADVEAVLAAVARTLKEVEGK